MNYEIGARVGDYEILEILGSGGMGRVYKVRNVLSDRIEAMKVLLPDLEGNPGLADRFMREIKVQASLDHPNIAALYAALRIENQLVMLMEYVEGITLERLIQAGPLPIDKAVDYMTQVLSALSYAHARGVVHRDLKPGNIMVTPSGLVKLMDFGIAKMAADRRLTQTGSTVGSLYYMSPEQIKGALDVDPRSDLYSLGVTLYEAVTGARPFQGDSEYSIMAAHLEKNPPPPIQIAPNLPSGLSEIIMQALEKDPARRFQSADAFRNALLHVYEPDRAAAFAAQATEASQSKVGVAPATRAQARGLRRALWIAVGAVIAIIVIVAVAIQIPKFRQTTAETTPIQATQESVEATTQLPEMVPLPAPAEQQAAEIASPASKSEAIPESGPAVRTESSSPSQYKPASKPTPSKILSSKQPAVEIPVGLDTQPESVVRSVSPVTVPSEDAAVAAQLDEVRKQMDLLGIRMQTVKESVENLRRQQAASGLGLRGDIAESAQRMEYYYGQAEAAHKKRDIEAAKKNLDLAEREVSKLERFLGR